MKYNVISYLIGEGFGNVLKNKKSTISALTIMCLCMMVFGLFFIIGENVNHIMSTIEEAQGIQVYLKKDTSATSIEEIGKQIKELDGVNKIEFKSKEDAFNEVKEGFKDNASALEGLSEDIMPPSYIVTLSNLSLNKQVQQNITTIVGDNLDEIRSSNETIEILMNISKGVRIFTFILLIILIVISLVIISNTIKLTVHARRKEISIMKYVGATNSFIRWPFIVEGIIIGIIAAFIAIFIVGLLYNGIVQNVLVGNDIVKSLGITFVTFKEMFNMMIIVYLILGIGIGAIGSTISMRKYLEV